MKKEKKSIAAPVILFRRKEFLEKCDRTGAS